MDEKARQLPEEMRKLYNTVVTSGNFNNPNSPQYKKLIEGLVTEELKAQGITDENALKKGVELFNRDYNQKSQLLTHHDTS